VSVVGLRGSFVVDTALPLGFARCEASDADSAEIAYTDLPEVAVKRCRVPIDRLAPQHLPEEMRVWLRNKFFGWSPGRVKSVLASGEYLLQFPGIAQPVSVPRDAITVRWDQPVTDPDIAVAIGMTDAPTYMRARLPLMQNLVAQRAACRGYTSILSAAVRPYLHQVDTMTRVLEDPLMRYVLADEVGLGKTIEAGLIIRQLFLDDPSTRVLVCVPGSLRVQWIKELTQKLLLGGMIESGNLQVVEYDDLPLLATLRPKMLVIDEAHRMVERGLQDAVEMAILRDAAHETESLLLLTATPLRGHARTFLGLLHLIDGDAYPLEDVSGFERRLEMREEQASAIELLDPQVPTTVLQEVVRAIREQHVDDPRVVNLVAKLESEIAKSEGPTESTLDALSSHLRETYRISRRVIRNRRSAVTETGFRVAGRQFVDIVIDDPARPITDVFLDEWRNVLLKEEGRSNAQFNEVLERCLAGPMALFLYLERRRAAIEDATANAVGPVEVALLDQTMSHLRTTGVNARFEAILDLVRPSQAKRQQKVVVFSCFSDVAEALTTLLRDKFGARAVASHLGSSSTEEQQISAQRFLEDRACRILVCDSSSEEGRNLQTATMLVHHDIPLSANRLEQRIGRVDRFHEALSERVPSLVLCEPGSVWVSSHLEFLRDGVGIFDTSAASLQRPLLAVHGRLLEDALAIGAEGLIRDADTLREELQEEREQIELLEEIEATSGTSVFDSVAVEDLEDFEETWGDTAAAFGRLFSEDGGIRLPVADVPDCPGLFSIQFDQQLRTVPLIPLHYLKELGPLLHGKLTYNRVVARRSPGSRLMRLGDPLVDWIDRYTRLDERGRASAIWRYIPGIQQPTLFFGFHFLIEFDDRVLSAYPSSIRERLRRRGDTLLPPGWETVWTNAQQEAPRNIVEDLLDPCIAHRGKNDRPLRGPRWNQALEHFPDWELRARSAGTHVHECLEARDSVKERVSEALDSADRFAQDRRKTLQWRAERIEGTLERSLAEAELQMEDELVSLIRTGLKTPQVSMVAAVATVVAGFQID